jgi:hypothetical protein
MIFQIKKQYFMDKEEKQGIAEMAEGYQAMAQEDKEFAEIAFKIAYEVIPEWK